MGIIRTTLSRIKNRIIPRKKPDYTIYVSGTPAGETRTTTGETVDTPGTPEQPGITFGGGGGSRTPTPTAEETKREADNEINRIEKQVVSRATSDYNRAFMGDRKINQREALELKRNLRETIQKNAAVEARKLYEQGYRIERTTGVVSGGGGGSTVNAEEQKQKLQELTKAYEEKYGAKDIVTPAFKKMVYIPSTAYQFVEKKILTPSSKFIKDTTIEVIESKANKINPYATPVSSFIAKGLSVDVPIGGVATELTKGYIKKDATISGKQVVGTVAGTAPYIAAYWNPYVAAPLLVGQVQTGVRQVRDPTFELEEKKEKAYEQFIKSDPQVEEGYRLPTKKEFFADPDVNEQLRRDTKMQGWMNIGLPIAFVSAAGIAKGVIRNVPIKKNIFGVRESIKTAEKRAAIMLKSEKNLIAQEKQIMKVRTERTNLLGESSGVSAAADTSTSKFAVSSVGDLKNQNIISKTLREKSLTGSEESFNIVKLRSPQGEFKYSPFISDSPIIVSRASTSKVMVRDFGELQVTATSRGNILGKKTNTRVTGFDIAKIPEGSKFAELSVFERGRGSRKTIKGGAGDVKVITEVNKPLVLKEKYIVNVGDKGVAIYKKVPVKKTRMTIEEVEGSLGIFPTQEKLAAQFKRGSIVERELSKEFPIGQVPIKRVNLFSPTIVNKKVVLKGEVVTGQSDIKVIETISKKDIGLKELDYPVYPGTRKSKPFSIIEDTPISPTTITTTSGSGTASKLELKTETLPTIKRPSMVKNVQVPKMTYMAQDGLPSMVGGSGMTTTIPYSGMGAYEKTAGASILSFGARSKSSDIGANFQLAKTSQSQMATQQQESLLKSETQTKQLTSQIVKTQQKQEVAQQQKIVQVQASLQRLTQKQVSALALKFKQIQSTQTRSTSPKIRKPTIKIPFTMSSTSGVSIQKAIKQLGGFEAFGKRFGKDVSLGSGSKEETKKKLTSFLKGTLGASGFITKSTGEKLKAEETGLLPKGFRKSKVSPYLIVERKSQRLKKGGQEVRDISLFRKGKKKKKSIF